jgi:hypothetical protein
MRKPKNQILTNQYTSGGDFIEKETLNTYQGYYYEDSGRYYIGKEFSPNSKELIKPEKSKENNLLNRLTPLALGLLASNLSKLKGLVSIEKINTKIGFQLAPNDTKRGYAMRYFAKKINSNPILIKEIDENTFNQLKNDITYQAITLKYYTPPAVGDINENYFDPKELNEADKKMSGLKLFLQP